MWTIFAATISLISAVQFIPQTITALRTKDLSGVSLSTFSILLFTTSMWTIYGLHINDYFIVFTNVVVAFCSFLIVSRKLKNKYLSNRPRHL